MLLVLPNKDIARDYKLEHIWQGFDVGNIPEPTPPPPPPPPEPKPAPNPTPAPAPAPAPAPKVEKPKQKEPEKPPVLPYKNLLGDATRADINIIQADTTKKVKDAGR